MTTMRLSRVMVGLAAAAAIPLGAAEVIPLKPVSAFARITDEKARSVALFVEAARVITSPRCMNCHPATRQATRGRGDQMFAIGGDENRVGVPATKDSAEPTRCHEKEALRVERNDFERLRDRRVTWLPRIASRRHRHMDVAVRRHEERDFRPALRDTASCPREQSGGARPLTSCM